MATLQRRVAHIWYNTPDVEPGPTGTADEPASPQLQIKLSMPGYMLLRRSAQPLHSAQRCSAPLHEASSPGVPACQLEPAWCALPQALHGCPAPPPSHLPPACRAAMPRACSGSGEGTSAVSRCGEGPSSTTIFREASDKLHEVRSLQPVWGPPSGGGSCSLCQQCWQGAVPCQCVQAAAAADKPSYAPPACWAPLL